MTNKQITGQIVRVPDVARIAHAWGHNSDSQMGTSGNDGPPDSERNRMGTMTRVYAVSWSTVWNGQNSSEPVADPGIGTGQVQYVRPIL